MTLGSTFAPAKKTPEHKLHHIILRLRSKVYAHTDDEGGRSIDEYRIQVEGDRAKVSWTEGVHLLDSQLVDPIRILASTQEERLGLEAARLATAIAQVQHDHRSG